jgi:RNA polymerase sigma-70 factor (ECF subfamily)
MVASMAEDRQADRVTMPQGQAEMTDELDIIRAVQAGDSACYRLLVERYYRPLLAFIFKMVGDRQTTEDIGQDVFFNAYRKIQDFDVNRGDSFASWLFTIARNNCIGYFRRKGLEVSVDIDQLADLLADQRKSPEEELLARERMSVIDTLLRQVPEPFRQTITMSLAGCSSKKIAGTQRIPLGTVKSRLFRARELMSSAYRCLLPQDK